MPTAYGRHHERRERWQSEQDRTRMRAVKPSAPERNGSGEGTLERLGVCATEASAFAIGLLKRVREPHDAPRIPAVGEPVCVGELVYAFGCRPMHVSIALRRVEPGCRENRYSTSGVRLPEDEVQVRRIQIDIRDAELSLVLRALESSQHVE
jgi:hypothetical protein